MCIDGRRVVLIDWRYPSRRDHYERGPTLGQSAVLPRVVRMFCTASYHASQLGSGVGGAARNVQPSPGVSFMKDCGG